MIETVGLEAESQHIQRREIPVQQPVLAPNRLFVADKQQQKAAARGVLPAGQRRRYPSTLAPTAGLHLER